MRFFILFVSLVFAPQMLAQSADWRFLATDDGEFTIEMPKICDAQFYNKDGIEVYDNSTGYNLKQMRLINCYHDETLLSVEIFETDKGKKVIEILADNETRDYDCEKMLLAKNLHGKECRVQTKDYSATARYIAAPTRVYAVFAAKRDQSGATRQKFFDSLRVAPADKTKPAKLTANAALISSLKNVQPEFADDTATPPIKPPANGAAPKSPTPDLNRQKLLIVSKPSPGYTDAARYNSVDGKILLRIAFGANARINRISALKTLPEGLLRNAVLAALRIKFLPETRDGKAVSISRPIEYTFRIY